MTDRIRTVSIIAHVDHGKSSLTDHLAGDLINEKNAGTQRLTDTMKEEKDRGITIRSTGVSTDCVDDNGNAIRINVVDTPGHSDFSGEVTAALRITDGALVLVDAVEGAATQTETVLRQAIQERVRVVLVINKMDRLFTELKDPDGVYLRVMSIVTAVNRIIAEYTTDESYLIRPEENMVCFTSAKFGWGFSVRMWATMFAKAMNPNATEDEVQSTIRKWWSGPVAFLKMFVTHLAAVYNATVVEPNKDKVLAMMKKFNVSLSQDDLAQSDNKFFGAVMKRWFPCRTALLQMIVTKLPSPAAAQRDRLPVLYSGPLDDDCANAIAACDPSGPLVMYVSKMIPHGSRPRRSCLYRWPRSFCRC
jgi:elongation factor 2